MLRKRISANVLIFAAILLAVALWIGSGVVTRGAPALPEQAERPPPVVAASWSRAEPVERFLTLYGEVAPDQVVRVRSQTAGQVAALGVRLGDVVVPGAELAQLDLADRPARLRRAQARAAQAERDYTAAEELLGRGTGTVARRDATLAEFEAARSDLATIEREIAETTIRSPVDGVVNAQIADVGDYVAVGGEVVEIVDNDPLRAVVQVPQHAVGRIRVGGPARVSMVGAQPVPGEVRFVAPIADAATRTFRVEVTVPNPDRSLPSGVSAEVVIPTDTVPAHLISPALVSLDDQGRLGVHSVEGGGVVHFHPIQVVRTDAEGVWVTGPPDEARLITLRPGFVSPGQRVDVRETPDGYGPTATRN